ncbi:glycoside hydrolase domain-containing protein [Bacteroides congonensis]|uniref:glycoside hydrolase domain-containing protein n=1 Tax=Bacteroides congonensis TaxID=1871006 RepID=UPI00338E4003
MAIQSPCLSSGCQVGWNNSIGYFDRTASSCKTKELPIGTDEYNEVWTTFLTSFRAHLTAKGWFDKTVEFCPPEYTGWNQYCRRFPYDIPYG